MRKSYLLTGLLSLLIVTSCKKFDFDYSAESEALGDFRLSSPQADLAIKLNATTPSNELKFTWSAAKPGVDITPTYTWLAAAKVPGNFDEPLLEMPSDNNGAGTSLTLTQKALDDALSAKGIAAGAKTDLIWSVRATNGAADVLSQDVFGISITRMKDGASSFVLLGPVSSATPIAIDPGSSTQNFAFRWTRSKPAPGGPAVTYKVLFSANADFSSPLFTLLPDAAPGDSAATITYQALSDSLNKHGQTDLSLPSNLKWTVVATSGTWTQQADFVNDFSVLREVRIYMPGSYQTSTGSGTDWTPADAPELIRDPRAGKINNIYYTYVYLPANAQFKFTQGRAWDVNYGGTNGTAVINSPDNFTVATAGVYRVSFDRTNMTYDIRQGRIGLVGDAITGVGWNPPGAFPASQLGYVSRNLFLGVYGFGTGGWKMIDSTDWDNGSVPDVKNTRSYGSSGSNALSINGPNMPDISTAGRYRIIWDGRDVNNLKYDLSPATEMRLVGNGINGVAEWTPGVSPQMTYSGNCIWTITVALLADKEIKFLAGNDWGAFDYEDNSGQSQATGTPRPIKWDGDKNFRTPATAGTYTITLNEMNQTVTIN